MYEKIVGQEFWHFISGDPHLYVEIIEPIGYRAREHNEEFDKGRASPENRFVKLFTEEFCDADGSINWFKLVAFNSANLR